MPGEFKECRAWTGKEYAKNRVQCVPARCFWKACAWYVLSDNMRRTQHRRIRRLRLWTC